MEVLDMKRGGSEGGFRWRFPIYTLDILFVGGVTFVVAMFVATEDVIF